MTKLNSRYRLTSTAFKRDDDENKINPKRMIILSVEGDDTEKDYFQHLNAHLDNALIQIEILRRKRGTGYSDPFNVIELLSEYLDVREGHLIPEELFDKLVEKYSQETLQAYLNNDEKLTSEVINGIEDELFRVGVDLEYRRYLQTFDNETDYFAVVLDRDCGSHSRELMQECFEVCKDRGCGYFVTNPCFEFWLLLHLCDVKTEYTIEELEKMKQNPKISNRHTVVSQEVSNRIHHAKHISLQQFEKNYFPCIPDALVRVQHFKTSYPEILDDIGTNLPLLFKELKLF